MCIRDSCYFLAIRSVSYAGRETPRDGGALPPALPSEPTPTPAPSPSPTVPGAGTIDDTTVRAIAIHDAADPARFRLALEASPAILAKVSQTRYDVDASFGSGRYATSTDRGTSFRTTTVYRTYDHDWRTNGATLTLVDGRTVNIAGAVIRF